VILRRSAADDYRCASRFADSDATRLLEYDIPSEGFSGRVRRALQMNPSGIMQVCVNDPAKMTGTSFIDVD
jgi:hypothetical protein